MEEAAVLVIENLGKRYPSAKDFAVRHFSLRLYGGKIYGFLGPNGAGKSTIIKSVVGMHGFEEGAISLCGHDVLKEPIAAKRDMGFVPDRYSLFENLSGEQYIHYIARLYKTPKKEIEERTASLLKTLGLVGHYHDPISSYSHGMKQKITLIAALCHNPKLLILDEPLTGLDPNSIFQIKQVMKEHAERGNVVFFSSHIIDLVKNLCDEVIILKKGVLMAQEKTAALKRQHIDLERFFLAKIGAELK
ncbi:MAG: ABC transporter ATP-binding protein [Bacilli bacterium]|jgi:ABC-2 type transport system ATP-binding protein|nr:ABC transporter ATP-binding protein [Bacilli bacterium]